MALKLLAKNGDFYAASEEYLDCLGRPNSTADKPFDTVLLSNTLHMIGPEGSANLLKHCAKLVSPGGRMIVQAQFLNDDFTSPRWPTLLSLIQRVATPNGRNHANGETTKWLEDAGFENVEYVRFSPWNVCSCLVGVKKS